MSKLKLYQDPAELNQDLAQVRTMLSNIKKFDNDDSPQRTTLKRQVLIQSLDKLLDPNTKNLESGVALLQSFLSTLREGFAVNGKLNARDDRTLKLTEYQILCAMTASKGGKQSNKADIAHAEYRKNQIYTELSKKISIWDHVVDRISGFAAMVNDFIDTVQHKTKNIIKAIIGSPTTSPPKSLNQKDIADDLSLNTPNEKAMLKSQSLANTENKLKLYQDPAELNQDLAQVRTMLSELRMFKSDLFEQQPKLREGQLRGLQDLLEQSIDPQSSLEVKEKAFKNFSTQLEEKFELNNKEGPEARKEIAVIQYQLLCAMAQGEQPKPYNKENIHITEQRIKDVYAQLSGEKIATKDQFIANIGQTSIWNRITDFALMIDNFVEKIPNKQHAVIKPSISVPTIPDVPNYSPPPVPSQEIPNYLPPPLPSKEMPNYPPPPVPSKEPLKSPSTLTVWQDKVTKSKGSQSQLRT